MVCVCVCGLPADIEYYRNWFSLAVETLGRGGIFYDGSAGGWPCGHDLILGIEKMTALFFLHHGGFYCVRRQKKLTVEKVWCPSKRLRQEPHPWTRRQRPDGLDS